MRAPGRGFRAAAVACVAGLIGIWIAGMGSSWGIGSREQARAAALGSHPSPSSAHAIKTVFIILMENHNWSSLAGNTREAPYINRKLLPMTSYATNYDNPPGNHPSLPNYLWLQGGQCYSYCGTDSSPSRAPHGISSTQHLTTLLDRAHISWREYAENIRDGTCPLNDAHPYAVRHNPFVYFNDVTRSLSYCSSHVRNYSDLASNLAHGAVARYNFITPNLCDDMHDPCFPRLNPIGQGDAWLSHAVPAIVRSAAYKHGGAIFVTWDEGEGGDGPIGMIVISPDCKGRGYHTAEHYTHSATLRTVEEIFGVKPFLGDASRGPDLRALFKRFP